MPIVGFNFDKFSVEKSGLVKKGMRASHNITINSIKQEDVFLGKDTKKPGLKFDFEYSVIYEPKVGEVIINGHILYLEKEDKIKEIISNWNKNKKIEAELSMQLINTAIVKSTIKALSLSQDVNLPPHLPIPLIAPKKNEKARDYIG